MELWTAQICHYFDTIRTFFFTASVTLFVVTLQMRKFVVCRQAGKQKQHWAVTDNKNPHSTMDSQRVNDQTKTTTPGSHQSVPSRVQERLTGQRVKSRRFCNKNCNLPQAIRVNNRFVSWKQDQLWSTNEEFLVYSATQCPSQSGDKDCASNLPITLLIEFLKFREDFKGTDSHHRPPATGDFRQSSLATLWKLQQEGESKHIPLEGLKFAWLVLT